MPASSNGGPDRRSDSLIDMLEEFLRLACLTYDADDGPQRWAAAREMWRRSPDLARSSPHAAAALGDVAALREQLAADGAAVHAQGPPYGTQALLCATYSRLAHGADGAPNADPTAAREERSTLEAARVLLDAGADPNAFFWWGEQYRFTALTGAFGEGESGPVRQPPHARWRELALLLLERGADPNDSQALYNTMFTPGDEVLRLLLEHGLGPAAATNWRERKADGSLGPHPSTTLRYQLEHAVAGGRLERVVLLLDHGSDCSTRTADGRSLWESATLSGHREIAALLAERGSPQRELEPAERLQSALLAGDGASARAALSADPSLLDDVVARRPDLLHDAASRGRLDVVRLLLEVGVDPDRLTRNTAAHEAAWHGHIEILELLYERGADLSLRDRSFGGTPLDWARHAGRTEAAAWLAAHAPS